MICRHVPTASYAPKANATAEGWESMSRAICARRAAFSDARLHHDGMLASRRLGSHFGFTTLMTIMMKRHMPYFADGMAERIFPAAAYDRFDEGDTRDDDARDSRNKPWRPRRARRRCFIDVIRARARRAWMKAFLRLWARCWDGLSGTGMIGDFTTRKRRS